MSSAQETYWKLSRDNNLTDLLTEVGTYLKSKLQLREVDGTHKYYSCGYPYHHWSVGWVPFRHLDPFCAGKNLHTQEVVDMISEHLGRKIDCECNIISDVEKNRLTEFRKSFGIDFGPFGNETCKLCED